MNQTGSFIIEIDLLTQQTQRLSMVQLNINPEEPHKLYWIHIDLKNEQEFNFISEKLQLPEDTLALCQEKELRSRLVETSDSLSILIQCPLSSFLETTGLTPVDNLLMHLTTRYCFTASRENNIAIKSLSGHYTRAIPYAKTPCFILFLLLDEALNTYSDLLYDYEILTENIDENINKTTYQSVAETKRQLMKTKRFITSIRDILMRISGRKIAVISEACRVSLQKLALHSEVMVNEADSIRDFCHTLLDQIDNGLIQQVNLTMKVLTGISAIFLPLTLITGIYGMNFHWIPELEWKYGYFWALGLMLCAGFGLWLLFKKKGWF